MKTERGGMIGQGCRRKSPTGEGVAREEEEGGKERGKTTIRLRDKIEEGRWRGKDEEGGMKR